jgi:hypothetical protein
MARIPSAERAARNRASARDSAATPDVPAGGGCSYSTALGGSNAVCTSGGRKRHLTCGFPATCRTGGIAVRRPPANPHNPSAYPAGPSSYPVIPSRCTRYLPGRLRPKRCRSIGLSLGPVWSTASPNWRWRRGCREALRKVLTQRLAGLSVDLNRHPWRQVLTWWRRRDLAVSGEHLSTRPRCA